MMTRRRMIKKTSMMIGGESIMMTRKMTRKKRIKMIKAEKIRRGFQQPEENKEFLTT